MPDALLLNKVPRIGVDLMGSDTPPEELASALSSLSGENLLLFASPEIARLLPTHLSCVPCLEVITMKDDPSTAVRRKKESSLCQGIRYLREKTIDAFISAGNTGSLLLAAKTKLKKLPCITRPALLTLLPTHKKEVAVLDVGANLTLKPHHLLQFAAIGIAYQKSRGIEQPTVGLLNIGTEATKGTPQVREAYAQLATLSTFLGNVEGKEVFQGAVDVLVTDGFTGNIFLKTAEGLATFILQQLQRSQHDISSLKERLYATDHPGAILCGVDGIVIKCHGDVTPTKLLSSIRGATRLVEHRFLEKILLHLNTQPVC